MLNAIEKKFEGGAQEFCEHTLEVGLSGGPEGSAVPALLNECLKRIEPPLKQKGVTIQLDMPEGATHGEKAEVIFNAVSNGAITLESGQMMIGMLNKAADIGEAAVNEIPLAVQELLKWKMAESIIENFIALLIALSMLRLYRKAYQVYKDKDLGNHPEITLLAFTVAAWMPVPFLINFDWLKIWIAPRIYLLEYAATLVR